jgi:hypothetical protein
MHHVFYCVPPSIEPVWDSSWADRWEALERADDLGVFAWVETVEGAKPQAQQLLQVYQRWQIHTCSWSDGPALTLPEVTTFAAFPDGERDLPGYATKEEAIAAEASNFEAWKLAYPCWPQRFIPPMPAECGPSESQ